MSFAPTIFLSAFLLFVVQLILGKFILPWFGGAPAVWTTCMMFFQVLLLLGYAYAHWVTARLSPAKQARLHLVVLAGSVLVMGVLFWQWHSPILPSKFWKPESPEQPVWQILRLLALSIGFPFFLLSATSPLLQRWLAPKSPAGNPYRFYALSNVGSLLGLLAYPFVVEPVMRLSTQALVWGIGYTFFAAACAACAVTVLQSAKGHTKSPPRPAMQGPTPAGATIALWLALAAITSSMFLSVTNNLCQDVAVVPFLWVLPLAIYLLSFILCFASGRWYHRTGFIVATAVASLALLKTAGQSSPFTLTTQILAHSCFLFVFCMICHGELVRLKPPPRHLTLFFLMVALGGVTGGVFVGLIAPFVFSGYWEFHVSLFAGWVVMAVILARDGMSAFHRGDRWQFAFVILLIGYPAISFALEFTPLRHVDFFWKNLLAVRVLISAIVTMFVLALCWRWPLAQSKYWPRVMVGGVICFVAYSAIQNVRGTHKQAVSARRNFYGVVRVVRDQVQVNGRLSPLLQLMHGQVNHGIQFQDDAFRQQPVGYYSKDSGIELAFRLHPRRQAGLPVNIGVLGLGAGTLAAFARAGDTIRFYEINPVVSGYSTGPRPYFTYLRDCKGRVDTVLGDARLSLQRELLANERGRFDILAMDAFSGDSVPVHLLTKEAFEIYLQHRRDKEGIIAVNISNRFLDLRALMFGLARRFGLHAVVIDCGGNPPERTPSRWCLMTKNQGFVADKLIQAAQQKEGAHGSILWTDDFSNLIQLLR